MRSHEEMAARVIKRRNEYLEQKKQRRAMIVKTATASLGTAAVVLFCFALWNNNLITDMRPDPEKLPVMVTDTTTTAVTDTADTKTSVQTDVKTQPIRTENTTTVSLAVTSKTTRTTASANTLSGSFNTRINDAPVITPSNQKTTHPRVSTTAAQNGTVTSAVQTGDSQTKTNKSTVRTSTRKTDAATATGKVTAINEQPVPVTIPAKTTKATPEIMTSSQPNHGESSTYPVTVHATTIDQHNWPVMTTVNPICVTTAHLTNIIAPATVEPQTTTVTTTVTTVPPIVNADFVEEFRYDDKAHHVSQIFVDPADVAELIGTQNIRRTVDGKIINISAEIYAVKDNDSTKVRAVRFNAQDVYYLCDVG